MNNGISKKVFVAGLLVMLLTAILSVAITASIITAKQGIQGEQGETGEQGVQGVQGEKGDAGNIEPYISASLVSYYTDVLLDVDYHDVEGYLINFGQSSAWDVTVTIQWHLYAGGFHEESFSISLWLDGYEIYRVEERFYFEGEYDYITWEIAWTT